MQRILILGAGTAGTMMANRLVRVLSPAWRVTVVDRDDEHLYQPGLLFIPFGMYRDDELVRPRHRTLDPRVELRLAAIDRIAPDAREVRLVGGEAIPYDFLIIATGSRIVPEATPGLTAAGWRQSAFDFYTLEGADALRGALERFPGGRLVVNVVEMPIKCPVAPLEFLFLAEAFFTQRGMRDKVEIVYATPLEGAFTKPVASAHLGGMLARRGIGVDRRLRRGRGRRRAPGAQGLRRARGAVRPPGHGAGPRGRGSDRGVGDGRRQRLGADRQVHAGGAQPRSRVRAG
jgi:sulfide:quinone oxidoreductase